MFTEKELINLPRLVVGIPVPHNSAACIMHLLRNEVSDIKVSLEDLWAEGATLVLSAHIRPYPDSMETPEEEEKIKFLREFWNSYLEEQKEKLGLNNPLTMAQIQRTNELIEQQKVRFADKSCWSQETIDYNEQFEEGLFDDIDNSDLWGDEDDD